MLRKVFILLALTFCSANLAYAQPVGTLTPATTASGTQLPCAAIGTSASTKGCTPAQIATAGGPVPISTGVGGLGSGVAAALSNTANAAGGFATYNGAASTYLSLTGGSVTGAITFTSAGSVTLNGFTKSNAGTDFGTACYTPSALQPAPIYAAHCWQGQSTTSNTNPQVGFMYNYAANANTGTGNEAVGTFLSAAFLSGAPQAWSLSNAIDIRPGFTHRGTGIENDIVNENCDTGNETALVTNCGPDVALVFDGIGGNGTTTFFNTAAITFETGNALPVHHSGIVAAGNSIKDEMIQDLSSDTRTITVGGSHTNAISTTAGTFSGPVINLATNQAIALDGTCATSCLKWDGGKNILLGHTNVAGLITTTASSGNTTIAEIGGAGAAFGWNQSGGLGEADIFSGGGIAFYGVNSSGVVGSRYFLVGGSGILTTANEMIAGGAATSGAMLSLQNTAGICTLTPTATTAVFSCSSDEGLKADFRLHTRALGYLDSFKVYDYTIRLTGERVTGVKAQEVQLLHPDMVHEEPRNNALRVDGVNPWEMVKAIQELHTITNRQQAEIVALTKQLKDRAENQATDLKAVHTELWQQDQRIAKLESIIAQNDNNGQMTHGRRHRKAGRVL